MPEASNFRTFWGVCACVRENVCGIVSVSEWVSEWICARWCDCMSVHVCEWMRESVVFLGKCQVTRMTTILALTLPLFAAFNREPPFPILLIGLHADFVEQKWHTWETCRFDDHAPMPLKMSALASHQKRFMILWTYIELGIHSAISGIHSNLQPRDPSSRL